MVMMLVVVVVVMAFTRSLHLLLRISIWHCIEGCSEYSDLNDNRSHAAHQCSGSIDGSKIVLYTRMGSNWVLCNCWSLERRSSIVWHSCASKRFLSGDVNGFERERDAMTSEHLLLCRRHDNSASHPIKYWRRDRRHDGRTSCAGTS